MATRTWVRPRKQIRVTDSYGSIVLRVRATNVLRSAYTVTDERTGETIGTIERHRRVAEPNAWRLRDSGGSEAAWFTKPEASPPIQATGERSTLGDLLRVSATMILFILVVLLSEAWPSEDDSSPGPYTITTPDGTRQGALWMGQITTLDLSADPDQTVDRRLALTAAMVITG